MASRAFKPTVNKAYGPGHGITGPEPAPLAPNIIPEKLPPTTRYQKYAYDAGLDRKAYFKAVAFLIVGLSVVAGTKAASVGQAEAIAYLGRYGMTLGLAAFVYILSCFVMVDYTGPLVRVILAIAGGVAMADMTQHLMNQTFLVYLLGLPWVVAMAVYAGIIADLLDLEVTEASILGILTYGGKVILKFTVFDAAASG